MLELPRQSAGGLGEHDGIDACSAERGAAMQDVLCRVIVVRNTCG
jgi:hypothetical protein